MKKSWEKITTLGINDEVDLSTGLKMRQLNRSTCFGFLTVLFFTLIFLSLTAFVPLLIGMGMGMLLTFILILKLNQKQLFKYARPLFILTINLGAILYPSILGPEAGAQLFFFCVVSSVFTFFHLSEKLKFFCYVVISPIAWISLELLDYNLGITRLELKPETLTFLYYTCIFISLSLCASLLHQFLFSNSAMRERLEETIDKLKTTQKEIESRNAELIKTQKLLSHNQIEIQEEKERAINALKVKSDFLSNISHEIRTPMNVIMGITDLLIDSELSNEKLSNLTLIKKSSNNLLIIINDILDFSKLESGKMTMEKVDFDLKAKIKDEIEGFRLAADKKGNSIDFIFDEDIATFVLGDPVRLGQVILNLISNANKFTDQGKITISVELVETQGNALQKLLFKVADTGIGISPHALNEIFNSFTQASSSTTRKFGGTGLGLAICKHIIEAMNGKIWANSKLKHGSEFYFEISLTKCSYETKKCLVLEDFDINQMVVINTLKHLNCSAYFCTNKVELLKKIDDPEIEFILINADNFNLNKYTTLFNKSQKVIIYSSNKRQLAQKVKQNEIIKGVLQLPFSPSDLGAHL